MVAANREQIKITGDVIMKLISKDKKGNCHIAKEMVYTSSCTNKFFSFKKYLHKTRYNKL